MDLACAKPAVSSRNSVLRTYYLKTNVFLVAGEERRLLCSDIGLTSTIHQVTMHLAPCSRTYQGRNTKDAY